LTEVESGRKSSRPKIAEALWLCRVYDAKLVIARLDRLARNAASIAKLLETGGAKSSARALAFSR
jgi:DNA invertase Pin-like site-specific DNA recombinase